MSADTVTIEPTARHTHTVIFLHGRGSNAADFATEFFHTPDSSTDKTLFEKLPTVKWILPTATSRYSPVFQETLHEWFDVRSLTDPQQLRDTQIEGLTESCARILKIIEKETETILSNKIFLGGISQGCATAIHTLMAADRTFAGFIGVAGWLPFLAEVQAISKVEANARPDAFLSLYTDSFDSLDGALLERATSSGNGFVKTPVWLCHGTDDGVVDVRLGRELRDVLTELGTDVTWRTDDRCGHWIKVPEAMNEMEAFIRRQIALEEQSTSS
ncbi:hypothetical protein AMS68_005127 [Peltaster fructicola]|uniref:Phospholipase/carboxylesterase/thioesterase domain-containing protein n=1 Tax=Peltaster fructicola TaxID=286661 RepID=A0A6H0XYW5_9PEZI|nr:hypothetical protein AMS68_005127 [Peltaster fructicola]